MKIKLLIAALVAISGMVLPRSYAQAVEPYEYAKPSDMTTKALILDVAEIGERLVAVGEYGHIIYSDDRGENWVQAQNVPTRNTITNITFLDDETGYAVGHDATILKTENGGESWSLKYIEPRGENPLSACNSQARLTALRWARFQPSWRPEMAERHGHSDRLSKTAMMTFT